MSSKRMKDRFDQAHLVNIANGLTTARVLLVPLFAYMLIEGRFRFALLVFAACGGPPPAGSDAPAASDGASTSTAPDSTRRS